MPLRPFAILSFFFFLFHSLYSAHGALCMIFMHIIMRQLVFFSEITALGIVLCCIMLCFWCLTPASGCVCVCVYVCSVALHF